MIALRPALTVAALLLLGAKLAPAPREPAAALSPVCPSSGIHGLAADHRGRRSFYLGSELAEIRRHFIASRWASREPLHIDILAAGAGQAADLLLEVHGPEGAHRCTATHLRRPDRCFDFEVSCSPPAGAAQARSVHWIWLDGHRALTDLLPAPASLADSRPACSSPFQELTLLRDPYLDLLKDPAYPEYPLQEVVELENPGEISALLERARWNDAGVLATPGVPSDAQGCR